MTIVPVTDPHAADVAVVIVTYRCADDALACLESLERTAPGVPIVVVDNASGDGTAARVAAWAATRPRCTVVESPSNLGFGPGCNAGIDRALADHPGLRHVLLLNPDCTAEPRFLDALRACAARHPDAGIVGGKILSLDGAHVWFEHGAWRPWTLGGAHVAAPSADPEHATGFVTGALMLVDAGLLRAGLRFDPAYFLYCEDMDFCREVVARGRTLWIDRRAVVRHRGGGSQRGEAALLGGLNTLQLRYITRNKAYLARKRLPFAQRLSCAFVAWVARPVAGVLRFRRVGFLPVYFRALVESSSMR